MPVWRTLGSSIRLIYRAGPARLIAFALASLAGGLLPAASVSAIANLVGAISAYAATRSQDDLDTSISGGIWFAVVMIATFVCGRLSAVFESSLRVNAGMAIRTTYLRKSATVDIDQFESPDTLDAIHRAGAEGADRVVGLIVKAFTVIAGVATLVSVAAILVAWDPLAAVLLLIAPFPSFVASVAMARTQYQVDVARTGKRRMANYLERLLMSASSIREIRLLGVSPRLLSRHRRIVEEIGKQDRGYIRKVAIIDGALGSAGVVLYLVAVWRSIVAALNVGSVGQLTGYLQAIGTLQHAAGQVVGGVSSGYEDVLYCANLFAYLDMPSASVPEGPWTFDGGAAASIELRHLSYTYPSRTDPTLTDVSLSVPAGSLVAIVGANGSGKTTLMRVLARLCMPGAGDLLLNGRPVQAYSLESLRASISMVFQDPVRFQFTLRENVTLGDATRDTLDSEVLERLTEVGAAPGSIGCSDLDETLGKELGNGRELSVGQWQRVAIARGLYRFGGLLLMDEPTASQDAMSERELVRVLSVMQDRTRVVVTHSAVVAAASDLVVVLENGSVRQVGPFDELYRSGGVLCEIFAGRGNAAD